jgi:hemerythrin-like metal-binding protein
MTKVDDTLIQWKKEFSVSHKAIDEQHQRFIALINAIHQAIISGKSSEALIPTVHAMASYAKEHFEYEEQQMAQCRYAEIREHIKEHQAFCSQVAVYVKDLRHHKEVNPWDVYQYLKFWFTHHILYSDQKYARYLALSVEDLLSSTE